MNRERLDAFELAIKSYSQEFRDIGLVIDKEPDRLGEFTNLDSVQLLSRMMIPPEYNDRPFIVNNTKFYGLSCIERVIGTEWLSYGDAGVVVGCPGPSLSGIIIQDFADEEQKEKYYSTLLEKPSWTFFALTEPKKGSDAMNIETNLKKIDGNSGKKMLNGEKYFIGNGTRADIGVVFARTTTGPLGIEMCLVEKGQDGFSAESLGTLGLRGPKLSKLMFQNVCINESQIIGRHLSPLKRGMHGAITVFNKMRPTVAAMALGVSQAVYDYMITNKKNLSLDQQLKLEHFQNELITVRNLIRQAALELDINPKNGYIGSIAKIRATALVKKITQYALDLFGEGSLFDHPHLNKWFRDAFAFENMEGTSNILKLNVFQSYMNGNISYV
ncbi:acyl-CoA dehydrogenase family protein [Lysinibacillus sp. FSL P4-0201]|uniref:acyl-CoA dehydrogenase family protein n=1 Tax=Lysinibacillus sp. FSL P4-0201 TaxID=2921721 RepID=UPI00315B37AD